MFFRKVVCNRPHHSVLPCGFTNKYFVTTFQLYLRNLVPDYIWGSERVITTYNELLRGNEFSKSNQTIPGTRVESVIATLSIFRITQNILSLETIWLEKPSTSETVSPGEHWVKQPQGGVLRKRPSGKYLLALNIPTPILHSPGNSGLNNPREGLLRTHPSGNYMLALNIPTPTTRKYWIKVNHFTLHAPPQP